MDDDGEKGVWLNIVGEGLENDSNWIHEKGRKWRDKGMMKGYKRRKASSEQDEDKVSERTEQRKNVPVVCD